LDSFWLGVIIGIGLIVAAHGITVTYILQIIVPQTQIQLDLLAKEQAAYVATIMSLVLVVIAFILQPLSNKINTTRLHKTSDLIQGAAWSFLLIHLTMTILGYEPLSSLLVEIKPLQ